MYGEFPIAQFDYRRVTGEFTIRFVVFGCFWCLARLRDLNLKPGRCLLVRLLYLSFTNLIYIIYNMYVYIYIYIHPPHYSIVYIYTYITLFYSVSLTYAFHSSHLQMCFRFLPGLAAQVKWRPMKAHSKAGNGWIYRPIPIGRGRGRGPGGACITHTHIYSHIVFIYLLDIVYCTYIYIHMYTYIYSHNTYIAICIYN